MMGKFWQQAGEAGIPHIYQKHTAWAVQASRKSLCGDAALEMGNTIRKVGKLSDGVCPRCHLVKKGSQHLSDLLGFCTENKQTAQEIANNLPSRPPGRTVVPHLTKLTIQGHLQCDTSEKYHKWWVLAPGGR